MSKILKAVIAGAGGLMIAAAQTKPDDAISNLAGWWGKMTGAIPTDGILAIPRIDDFVTFVGTALILGVIVAWVVRGTKANRMTTLNLSWRCDHCGQSTACVD